ncbi:hypothetical protein [Ralstonia phage phiRSL1]|uniref:Uncharacterized protein n=1 Tax=Ralstonia phage phiRSL1 TaxID=1980924 RepID=B2ZYJ2_9CAUD|nr:hypothetical protein RSL1_ORF320 [Ralstonia phage phiRSL1]BAG41768.2 hypothetical protein [Ralstonia phage phiRSL1]
MSCGKDLTPEPLSWERGVQALSNLPTKAEVLNYTLGFHLYSDEHHVYIARSVSRRLSHLQEDVLAIPKQAIVETLSLLSYEHQDDRRARIDAYKKASTTR